LSKAFSRTIALLFLLALAVHPRATAQSVLTVVAGNLRGLNRLAPTPNYLSRVKKREPWKQFPLKVFFLRDQEFASARQVMACHGFDRWVIASDGMFEYEVTAEPREAVIFVRFDRKTDNGLTQVGRDKAHHLRALITIGVRNGAQSDIEAIAAHEYGHALGIEGHSDSKRDLMYPVHWAGNHGRVSPRDLNTLAASYPALARLIAQRQTTSAHR
jgi:hypothetical protein